MKALTVLLCLGLPSIVLSRFDNCDINLAPNGPTFPNNGQTGYRSYQYTTDNTGECNGITETCRTEFPNNNQLRGRTWFLTNNREDTGNFYAQSFMQLYRVQCPEGTQLHLYPQRLQTERNPVDANCINQDYVQIRHPDFDQNDIFCGNDTSESEIFNGGVGRIVSNSNVTVEFCTNPNQNLGLPTNIGRRSLIQNPVFTGFVIRATCIDPRETYFEGCVNFQAVRAWDPEWLAAVAPPYEKPERLNIPHKRSVHETHKVMQNKIRRFKARDKRMERRFKKFTRSQVITFSEGQTVDYSQGKFTFNFNNGSLPFCPPGFFFCAIVQSDFFGTRRLFGESPFPTPFTGPGRLEIDDSGIAKLFFTVNESDSTAVQGLLVPGPDVTMRINAIYEYIFDCWVFPYPVVFQAGDGGTPRPLTLLRSDFADVELVRQREGLESFGGQIEGTRYLNWLDESIWPGMDRTCFRGTLIRAAPRFGSFIPRRLYEFCGLFYYSCDPLLAIACRELLNLK